MGHESRRLDETAGDTPCRERTSGEQKIVLFQWSASIAPGVIDRVQQLGRRGDGGGGLAVCIGVGQGRAIAVEVEVDEA